MDTLLAFQSKSDAESYQRELNLEPLSKYDPDIKKKYDALPADKKELVNKLINSLTKGKQHMGFNFSQIIKQFSNTDPEIPLETFAVFLAEYDHNINNEVAYPYRKEIKERIHAFYQKIGDLQNSINRRVLNPQSASKRMQYYKSEINKLEEKYDNVEIREINKEDLADDRIKSLVDLYGTKTFQPYFRTDEEKLEEKPSYTRYIFVELICLYLGIDLDLIIHGTGKSYEINLGNDPDPDLLFDTWASMAEQCDFEYEKLLSENKKPTYENLPKVDFEQVYEQAFGEKASVFYGTIRESSAPLMLSEDNVNTVLTIINA